MAELLEIKRSAPLTDIPARLRILADLIEADIAQGHEGPAHVIVVGHYQEADDFRTFAYGQVPHPLQVAGLLLGVANWMAVNQVERPAPTGFTPEAG